MFYPYTSAIRSVRALVSCCCLVIVAAVKAIGAWLLLFATSLSANSYECFNWTRVCVRRTHYNLFSLQFKLTKFGLNILVTDRGLKPNYYSGGEGGRTCKGKLSALAFC